MNMQAIEESLSKMKSGESILIEKMENGDFEMTVSTIVEFGNLTKE